MGLGDIKGNIAGAARLAAHLATGPLHSQERRTWGATAREVEEQLPGDDLLLEISWQSTRAVTIWATPDQVWPWVLQIGHGRKGFSAHELMTGLVAEHGQGYQVMRTDRDEVAVGADVWLHNQLPPLQVAELVSDERLVLVGIPEDNPLAQTVWSYHLRALPHGRTRLIERTAFLHGDSLVKKLAGGPYVVEPVSFMMSRDMLLAVKKLAEESTGPAALEA
ncbi:hypothetical protein MM440_07865 [Arsenicicoccus piscis]|uniref:SRPBCC family protein n=1 Tax=Arsenicicoccus piscis TaxID=673954 RepID=A0ABQ6HIE2_9MICO|nr:hypothetical protein [Arsenicicoccus piscis]MCH8627702.1 hypothetical protein [Arsenicicoccus piscis]GMA18207.1 hypothetical protein GCM10025862_02280 [Arsenicicoccus piscis]